MIRKMKKVLMIIAVLAILIFLYLTCIEHIFVTGIKTYSDKEMKLAMQKLSSETINVLQQNGYSEKEIISSIDANGGYVSAEHLVEDVTMEEVMVTFEKKNHKIVYGIAMDKKLSEKEVQPLHLKKESGLYAELTSINMNKWSKEKVKNMELALTAGIQKQMNHQESEYVDEYPYDLWQTWYIDLCISDRQGMYYGMHMNGSGYVTK